MAKSRVWPFVEAESISRYVADKDKQEVIFETGFGPSGLPHIGTFAEVARTTWVRNAITHLTGRPTRLIAFSDDMDGLRKVPLNVPNREMLAENLGRPLCEIPDPFGCCESYSGHMNNKLKQFLDAYGFDYEFQSAYEAYRRGDFDAGLARILDNVEQIKELILSTMSEEKRKGWSPFMPICENCGRVYSTRVTAYLKEERALEYACDRRDEKAKGCGYSGRTSIFGGRVKVGWKVDWALRWYSYNVDYEMYGKDLIDSARLSARIVGVLGKRPPLGYFYELFLDEEGKKISKSVGEGLTVDTWVGYAPLASLLYYLMHNPRKARRLTWDIIPRAVDDLLEELKTYPDLSKEEKEETNVWHIYNCGREVPTYTSSVNYSLINNLLAGVGTDDVELLFGFLERYDGKVKENNAFIRDLIERCLKYYRDHVLPYKEYYRPQDAEQELLKELACRVAVPSDDSEDGYQQIPFALAREKGVQPAELFRLFYRTVLGQERGPRFGTLVCLLGKERMEKLLLAKVEGS